MNEKEVIENNWIDKIRPEANKALFDCEELISKELARVSEFTGKDLDQLIKMIFENCGDISELDAAIAYLMKNISQNRSIVERMNNQKRLTKEDIIDENIFNIFGVYGASALVTYLISSNPLEFTKNFLIFALIGITTFKINLDYFTGDYRKKQIAEYLTRLNRTIEIDDFNIDVLKKLRAMCIDELQYETIKLYEIIKDNNNYELATRKVEELIKGMGIAPIVDSKNVKTLRKK